MKTDADFKNFADILADLERRGLFHVELGLERMRVALRALELLNAPFRIVQVLGTNGKGSTATFLDSLARAHGLRCGLFTSPHFLSPRERILVNGLEADENDWLSAFNQIMSSVPNARELTYFEILTVAAMLIFKNRGLDVAIFEAGLGGKNDATSALPVSLHVFTPIDIDHAAVIGPDLRAIAKDKAAAIRAGNPVFSSRQEEIPAQILRQAFLLAKTAPVFTNPVPDRTPLGLCGAQQKINAGLAQAAFEELAAMSGIAPQENLIAKGFASAFIPGRLQWAHDGLLLDGGHNPHALCSVLPEAKKLLGEDINIIFSALSDKDWPQMTEILLGHFPGALYLVPRLDNPRAANPAEIADALGRKARATVFESVAQALAASHDRASLAIGSLYLLAEIYKIHPQYLYGRNNNVE